MSKKERKENVEREIWDWERRKSQEEMKRRKRKEMASPLPLFNKVNNKLKE